MNYKHFFVLAGITLAVVLLAVFLIQQKHPGPPIDSHSLFYPALPAQVNEVAEIGIHSQNEQFTLIRRENAWTLKEKQDYPVAVEKVRALILGLAELRLQEMMTRKPENYAKLGVEDLSADKAESVRVTLKSAGGETLADLLVGHRRAAKSDPGRNEIYARIPGEAQSWLTVGSVSPGGKALDWMQREIINIGIERIRELTLSQADGGSLRLFKDKAEASEFQLAEIPAGQKLKSPYELSALAGLLSGLELEEVKPAAGQDLSAPPQTLAVFETFDGLQVSLRLLEQDGQTYAALRTAAVTGENTEQNAARHTEAEDLNRRLAPWLYQLPAHKTQTLAKKAADLLEAANAPDTVLPDDLAHPSTASPMRLIETLGK